ncbi:MAG: FecR domain-containing protein [Spirochaetia bacterium]|nr:FecR domain-containing protein [Spirochaetia bacterium]
MKTSLSLIFLLASVLLLNGPGYAESCKKECVTGDCQNGIGTQTYVNCDTYQGNFVKGMRTGEGIYSFHNGDVYKGTFKDGARAGKGVYSFKQTKTQAQPFIFESNLDDEGRGTGVLKSGKYIVTCDVGQGSAACGDDKKLILKEATEPIAIVLYAGKSASMERSGALHPMLAGDPVLPGDTLKSGQENLDMQLRDSVSVRMKPQAEATFSPIPEEKKIDLKQGSMIVKFRKETGGLAITAPAAEVHADDSTLSIQASQGSTEVKVFEVDKGKVTVAPRFAELENKSRSEIEKDPALKKMEEKRQSLTIPVAPNAVAILERSAATEAKQARVEKFEISPQERAETKVMVKVDEKAIQNLKENPRNEEHRRSVLASYDAGVEIAMDELEIELKAKPIKSEKEILERYGIVEFVTLRDGTAFPGAIVTQAGDTMLIHRVGSVSRIKTSKVHFVDYKHADEIK